MTWAEARKLDNGVYRLHWKAGGYSLAAVGRLHDGVPWYAAANWVAEDAGGIASTKWGLVARVELIEAKP